jgi:hypothetical protein
MLSFCPSTSSLSLLVLWIRKLCRFILFIETFWKFTTRIFISIFSYSNDRHGPQEELARFSYRWERKVENWRILLYLASCWNLWFKYSNFRKVNPQKSDDFGAFFSQKSFVYESHWTFFGEKSWCSQLVRFLCGSCKNEILQVHIIYWNILQTHNLLFSDLKSFDSSDFICVLECWKFEL